LPGKNKPSGLDQQLIANSGNQKAGAVCGDRKGALVLMDRERLHCRCSGVFHGENFLIFFFLFKV
jgi:hypothetical protein